MANWIKNLTSAMFGPSKPRRAGEGRPDGLKSSRAARDIMVDRRAYSYSVSVNACVQQYANNIANATPRVFDRRGKELLRGPLLDLIRRPLPRVTWMDLITLSITDICLSGQFFWRKLFDEQGVFRLARLDPERMSVENPHGIEYAHEIDAWRYFSLHGREERIPNEQVIQVRFANPMSNIYGARPLLVGAVSAAAETNIDKYNEAFFRNGGVVSHILRVGGMMTQDQRSDLEERYTSEFSVASGNAHRVMVVSSDELEILPMNDRPRDEGIVSLGDYYLLKMCRVFGVPPLLVGVYSDATMRAANEAYTSFHEMRLGPLMKSISDVVQSQLVEPHYQYVGSVGNEFSDTPKMVRGTKAYKTWCRAMDEKPSARYLFILDPDTMPLMARIRAQAIAAASEFRKATDASATEIIEYFDLGLEHRPERDDIYINAASINITNPSKNAEIHGSNNLGARPETETGRPPEAGTVTRQVSRSRMRTILHQLRKATLDSIECGMMWSPSDWDDDDTFLVSCHLYEALAKAVDSKDSKNVDKVLNDAKAMKWN